MRIAPEGRPFIILAWTIVAGLVVFGFWWAAIPMALVAGWVVAFFRDPSRTGRRGDDVVIAPADGLVVGIIPIDEPKVIGGAAIRISIFMNVFSVHVNRYPVSGTITFRHYQKGAFGHAGREKAALENEHSDIGITSPNGALLTRQIAGSIARRIVTDHDTGTVVRQGDRLGLIRFGSRVDVFLPASAKILVTEGDLTQAGVTVLAQWK
jgi:phosphatidylserine decarboxylase